MDGDGKGPAGTVKSIRGSQQLTKPGSQEASSPQPAGASPPSLTGAIDEVEIRGYIVDSLLLPKILDRILQMGGSFEIHECKIGVRRVDPSYARIAIRAATVADVESIV